MRGGYGYGARTQLDLWASVTGIIDLGLPVLCPYRLVFVMVDRCRDEKVDLRGGEGSALHGRPVEM